ncbi:hypothetical protein AVEN_181022-1 [Araneus ventricosus]|uniref:Uncharacterized protein n=1 Tax=Araneus ventricosus TaxID=182803 RepID=A0A4Y2TKP6_ARAVE|nr:hypothetical protein AVEN_181022-1 [Araneus ventricosus]
MEIFFVFALVMCRSLRKESADPAPQNEQPDAIPTKRNESGESDLLIPRHHEFDSDSLIRILEEDLFRSGMNDILFRVMDADKFLCEQQERMVRFG